MKGGCPVAFALKAQNWYSPGETKENNEAPRIVYDMTDTQPGWVSSAYECTVPTGTGSVHPLASQRGWVSSAYECTVPTGTGSVHPLASQRG
jgi:hypothetical protein